jgi:hypothetical protein
MSTIIVELRGLLGDEKECDMTEFLIKIINEG